MPRTSTTGRRTAQAAPQTVAALQSLNQAQVQTFVTVANTHAAYAGYLSRGRKFLQELVAKRRANGEGDVCAAGIQTAELEQAFDGDKPPNRYSALGVELFLTQKCLHEGLGVSTADGIHGAFCALWDNMAGDRYAGKYELDEATGEVHGCPARAPKVAELMHCIKVRAKSQGASAARNHADAMTIEEIKRLIQWSTSVCPDEMLTVDAKTIKNVDDLMFRLEHGFMRAFISSAFTLWTRCFELLSLQAQDVELNCQGPAPYHVPHFKVHLNHRKGWQHEKGYDGPRTSNVYEIYQQEIWEIDMNTHFLRWKTFLESYLGTPLGPLDFLFPHLAVNGVIRATRAMSYDSLMALLARFCGGAGIAKRYTTHSFRRGGAQYRFMFAPIGTRWSLNTIRWWGGWAVGEHVDTLIKYLVDSLQSFENGHGDALHPIPIQPDMSFMGDHVAAQTVTGVEFRQFGHSVNRKFEEITTLIKSGAYPAIQHVNGGVAGKIVPAAMPTVRGDKNVPVSLTAAHEGTRVQEAPSALNFTYVPMSYSTQVVEASLMATSGLMSAQPTSLQGTGTYLDSPTSLVPRLPQVSIAHLGRGPGAWRRAITQWEEVDPVTGLALKDWPSEWYRDEQRVKVGSLRSQRQLIFDEFERLGRDEGVFLAKYPVAEKSVAKLLEAIRINNGARRSSKNREIAKAKGERRRRPRNCI